jgi:hypothetical protein
VGNLRKRIAVGIAAIGMAAAVSVTVAPSPAQAATGWARCPAGYFCVFDGANGTGHFAYFQWGSPDLRGQTMNNKTTSYWNRTSRRWHLWDGYNYTGGVVVAQVPPSDRSTIPSTWFANNRASSLKAI